jgi:branched-chain amino acid transport system substrate-binding protein
MSEESKEMFDEGAQGGFLDGKRVSRREFLKIAGITGVAIGVSSGMGGLLAACGGEETTTTTAATAGTTTTAAGTSTTAAASTTTVSAGPEAGREIVIGDVSPLTGALAVFGQAEKWGLDLAARTLGDGIVLGDGKKHKVTFKIDDTQSDAMKAGQIAADFIMNEKVDMMVAAGTPDTVNPAADNCETLGCPLVSQMNPWQAFIFGRGADMKTEYKWIYGAYFGAEQEVASQLMVYNKIATNKKVGFLFGNDTDGNVWAGVLPDGFKAAGYEVTFPAQYTPGAEDFTTQIAEFKKAGCEIISGTHYPPDAANFWKQCLQQGYKPKMVFVGGKAFTNMSFAESMGSTSIGLMAGWAYHRNFPYIDPFTGMNCRELADDYEKFTGEQWAQAVGSFAKISWAIDVLKRAKNPEDKETIAEAILATKMETCIGPIDFTLPVDPAGRRITKNVYKQGWTTVQCVKGADALPEASTRQYEVNIVGVEGYPEDLVVAPITQNYA